MSPTYETRSEFTKPALSCEARPAEACLSSAVRLFQADQLCFPSPCSGKPVPFGASPCHKHYRETHSFDSKLSVFDSVPLAASFLSLQASVFASVPLTASFLSLRAFLGEQATAFLGQQGQPASPARAHRARARRAPRARRRPAPRTPRSPPCPCAPPASHSSSPI